MQCLKDTFSLSPECSRTVGAPKDQDILNLQESSTNITESQTSLA